MKKGIMYIIGMLGLLCMPQMSFTQGFLNAINPKEFKGNFIEMAAQIDMYYNTAVGSNKSGYKQWKRWEWFASQHLDGTGRLESYVGKNTQAVKALESMSLDRSRMSTTGDWINLGHAGSNGPEAQQGRVNSVAFDPVNSAIVYAATAGGGIWKTNNNGDTWMNLTVDLPILGISDIVVSPAPNNNILYALIGDVITGNVYFHNSIGVIKSYNSGLSWTRTNLSLNLSQQFNGNKLLMHPTNSNIVLAALEDGIHRTMDGGNTWALTAAVGNINDMEFKPSDPNVLYFTTRISNNFSTLNLTTNSVTSLLINSVLNVDRMEIGVTPNNGNAVYLLAGPGYVIGGVNLFNGLFYSGNSGGSFAMRSNTCTNNGDLFNSSRSLSWYANTLYVDPNNENNVLVGGLNAFQSTDGGVTLNEVTATAIHSDQHNIKRNPLNGDLWLCNDGGVYRSTDNGSTWSNRSDGLVINEYYRISGTNNADDRLIGGAQDNGHLLRNPSGDFLWVLGGDGMDNIFNSINNMKVYACKQNGDLWASSDGGNSFTPSFLPNRGNPNFYPWITPIVQQPPHFVFPEWENPDIVYAYSLDGIMRSTENPSWINIGPPGIGETSGAKSPSMAICSDDQGANTSLYISNGNNFWVCTNPMAGNPIWTVKPLPISNTTFTSSIAVNPANRNEAWVTISGYEAGVKVFRSTNSGTTWSNLSLSLPNIPVYSIAFANTTNSPSGAVYVGTEIGVFYTDDSLPDWIPFSNALPHVPVTDLEMNYVAGQIKAATYGRGIWQSDLYEACPSLVLVDFDINQGQYNFESSNAIYAYNPISGGLGVNVTMKAANQIKLLPGFRIYQDSRMKIKIGNCGSGIIGLSTNPATKPERSEDINIERVNRTNDD